MQPDEAFVEHDADRRLAVAEGDDPDPVAESHVVIRREAARADVLRREFAAGRDVVDVADVFPAAPDRRGGMFVVALDEAESASEKIHASARVEQPAARHFAHFVADLDRHAMIEIADRHVARFRRTPQLRAFGYGSREQVLIERIAPQLKRGHGASDESAALAGVRRSGEALVREPVAQSFFRKLFALEVVPDRERTASERRTALLV